MVFEDQNSWEQDKTGKVWYVKNYCHMNKNPEISDRV